MWRFAMSIMIFISFPISVFPWWETVVDTVETHYPNGQLKESYQTVFWGGNESTSKTGFYRSWYENGQLEWDGQYAGVKVHTWIKWDSTGRRVKEISYLAGEKHGSEIEWNPNGTIRKELNYRNDTLHGLCTWRKANYSINGLANNPNLTIQVQSFYVDGKLLVPITKETHQVGNGYPCVHAPNPYYNAEHDLWVECHSHPSTFFVGRKVDGKKQGAWILWTQSGNVKKVEFYDKDKLLISE